MPVILSPADARTLGDLKTRIADELARADLASQIALAITDAISEASTHRFWFMETRGLEIPVETGDDTYSSEDLDALSEIDRIVLVVDGQRRTLRMMNPAEMDRLNDGTAPTGEPYAFSRYGNELRLYPTPQRTYTVLIDGLTAGAVLTNDTDTNIWTTTGERYVRALAKRNLLADVIRDSEGALAQDALAQRYREELWSQTDTRTATREMACNG